MIDLPQRRNAIKALRQAKVKRFHNLDIKTDLKKTIKKFLLAVRDKKNDEASQGLRIVFKKIDKAAKRNLIHKNTAARRKSRYSKILAGLKV